MTKKLFALAIFVGIFLRVLLSIFTYHRDIAAYTTSAKLILVEGHLSDFYDAVLRPDPRGRDYQLSFNYQPLAYLIPAAIYAPFTPLVDSVADGLRHTDPFALAGQTFFLPLFIFKLPFLLADLLILFLLPKLFDPKKRRPVQALWALNPVAVFVGSMLGQVDMILLLFIVIALLFHRQKRFLLSAVCLGLSALTKPTALLILPFLAVDYFHYSKHFLRSLGVLLAGLTIFVIGLLPYLSSPNYRATALFTDLLSKSTYAGIAISPGYAIPWFFIGYSLAFYLFFTRRISALMAFGAAIFSSLAFTHFHPQWFLWITPWLIYLIVEKRLYLIALLTLFSWLVIWTSFGSALHLEMFFGFHFSLALPAVILSQAQSLVLLARSWLIAFFALLLSHPHEQTA